jgi:uncharacterized membrane protein YozB (DUF420 family)
MRGKLIYRTLTTRAGIFGFLFLFLLRMISSNKAFLILIVIFEFFWRQNIWEFREDHREILHGIFFIILLFVGYYLKYLGVLNQDPWNSVFSVLCVKAVFLFIPFSFEILLQIFRASWDISLTIFRVILRVVDASPLWLLAAVGPVLLGPLAKITSVYLKWWLWGTLWTIAGFSLGAFALLSSLLGN